MGSGRQLAVAVERLLMQKRAVAALFALALGLRLLLILTLPQPPFSDGEYYFSRAVLIAAGEGYQEQGIPTAFWPVGYPALIAASMLIFGPNLIGPMLINLASAALILWLILWFGREVAGSRLAGRFAAALYAIYPAHIAYTGAVVAETSYTAIVMAAFALLIARRGHWRGLLAAGLLFGFASLIRPQTLLFPVGAIVALLIVYRDFGWAKAASALMIVHLAIAAILLPWSLRNQQVFGEFVLVSTNGGVALITGANDDATGDYFPWERGPLWDAAGVPWEERTARQVELDAKFKAMAVEWIKANPDRYLALGPVKAATLWLKDSDGFWALKKAYPQHERELAAAQWINQLFYAALLALAAVAFAFAIWAVLTASPAAPIALLFSMPVFCSLLAFVFTGQIRYHYPAMPFLIVAAGWTLARLTARVAATGKQALGERREARL